MGRGALAFLAGFGSGALQQYSRNKDKERQDKFDQIALDKADDDKQERDHVKKIRSEVSNAAQDGNVVEIEDKSTPIKAPPQPVLIPTVQAQTNESQPLAAQGFSPTKEPAPQIVQAESQPQATTLAAQGLPKSTWQMGGKSFSDVDSANKATQEYNTPESRNARIAQAYLKNGEVDKALDIEQRINQVKDSGITSETRQMELKRMKADEARISFGRGMVDSYKTGGSNSLMSYLSDSHADGKEGGMKFEQQLSQDGQMASVFTTNEKGEKIKVADVPNNEEGWQLAMFKLQKGLDPNALMAHSAQSQKQALEERKVRATEMKAESDSRRADANERKIDAYIMGRGSNNTFGVSSADLEKASNTINSRITEIFQPKEGSTPEERSALGVTRNQAAAAATGIWAVNNKTGNYIDAGTAVYALDLASNPKNLKTKQDSDGNTYPGVMVNGGFVMTGTASKFIGNTTPKPSPPPSKAPPPVATNQEVKEVPKASEYKGEGIGTKIINRIQGGWGNVKEFDENLKKSKQEQREQSQAAWTKTLIDNKMKISDKQKALAIKYGFLSK